MQTINWEDMVVEKEGMTTGREDGWLWCILYSRIREGTINGAGVQSLRACFQCPPPSRILHLLKCLQFPQRGPPVGDQEFKDVSPWRTVHTQIRRPHGYKETSEISDGANGEVTIGLRL